MELKAVNTFVVVGFAFLYALAALTLTCGCTLRVGDGPCLEYARALEVRLLECELLPDDWYAEQLRRAYARCDETGPTGLTLTEASDVEDCVGQVKATSCERIQRGAPSCMGMVKL